MEASSAIGVAIRIATWDWVVEQEANLWQIQATEFKAG